MTTLKNLTIYTEEGILKNAYIKFDKTISEIGTGNIDGIDMKGKILIPGYIEQHIHGVSGADTMDATFEAIDAMVTNLPKEGITSFFPTTMTETEENIINALKNIKEYKEKSTSKGADIVGVHLEGPFINIKFKGAQRGDAIRKPSVELFKKFNEASGNLVKHVTFAPEIEGADEFIKYLKANKIVASIGHTNATDEEAFNAIKLGANHFTHAYNAMSPFHHRNIGVIGAMLLSDNTFAEVITDGIHSSFNAVKMLYKSKGYKNIVLITDSMRAKLLPDGESEIGGQKVYVKGLEARLEDGTLAGSILRFEDGVKNFRRVNNCSIEEIIEMASVNPAKLHNLFDSKGSIKVGKDADFIITNDNLDVLETYCLGVRLK
ncbi:N-acetylglucosamine-6-phosphate deacetylase [Haploplasma axanthum]|uniref:N-acetylglucosamine-6-phosphate deacetylase n=1 Tax=Haploplasma axanthum TaxID=29552 RepID=A0A449BFV8_HAPAX|nr:N-acetylglucosamine-6-phosphate deacetylase [Haploplasma axanthum]VEU81323.1 N-acetylglucosamine-6-phosphate deacetylase [Haploplasma axanthum]